MQDAGNMVKRGFTEDASWPTDILKRLKPALTQHYYGTTT